MSSTKKTMYTVSAFCLVFMFTFFNLYVKTGRELCLIIAVICMTAAYHIIIRLVIGTFCDAAFENEIDPNHGWFAESEIEQAFYHAIGVKHWKGKLPMFDEDAFSLKKRSLEDIIAVSCQTEIVHEINVAASMLAILFTIPFGLFWVFLLTSVAGAVFDMIYVIEQRFNRPRLMRAAERQRKKFFDQLAYEEACSEEGGSDKSEETNTEDERSNSSTKQDEGEVNGDTEENEDLGG